MFLTLINEAFEEIFQLNSRAHRTLVALLFKPGRLTHEYFIGRRARYVQPLRLYIICSVSFFLLVSVLNFFNHGARLQFGHQVDEENPVVEQLTHADAAETEKTKNEDVAIDDDENSAIGDGEIDLPFVTDEENAQFKELLERQIKKVQTMVKEDPGEVMSELMDPLPPVIFCLLPIFALLLKIMFMFSNRYYTEHLVLAVHNHCYLFVALSILALSPLIFANFPGVNTTLRTSIFIWTPIYMLLSMKNAYEQSWPLTVLKFLLLSVAYLMLLTTALGIAAIFGLLTL